MNNDDDIPNINKILGHAALLGIEKIGKKTLNTIKESWLKLNNTYGFTIKPKEDNLLKEIARNKTYLAFKDCVGNDFEYTRFIKVGLLLYKLNIEGKSERIKIIRKEIYNSKYNQYAMKIIHIASTGVLIHVLSYLVDLKDQQRLSKYAMRLEFKKILNLWSQVSVSIGNKDTINERKQIILSLIQQSPSIIIVYAAENTSDNVQSAVDRAQRLVAELKVKEIYQDKYMLWCKTLEFPGFTQYLAIFYALNSGLNNPFSD